MSQQGPKPGIFTSQLIFLTEPVSTRQLRPPLTSVSIYHPSFESFFNTETAIDRSWNDFHPNPKKLLPNTVSDENSIFSSPKPSLAFPAKLNATVLNSSEIVNKKTRNYNTSNSDNNYHNDDNTSNINITRNSDNNSHNTSSSDCLRSQQQQSNTSVPIPTTAIMPATILTAETIPVTASAVVSNCT